MWGFGVLCPKTVPGQPTKKAKFGKLLGRALLNAGGPNPKNLLRLFLP